MAITAIAQLKNWFKTGLKPTQEQFWNWMDSYWHKSEAIPQNKVENLADSLAAKAAANHTHADYIKTDASNLDEGSRAQLKAALDIDNIDDSKSEISEEYPDLGLETGSKQSDYNAAVANKLEIQQSAIDNKLPKPEDEGTTEDYPFVLVLDENNLPAKAPAGDLGRNIGNADLSLTEPRALDTNGNPFSIQELPDKKNDATFNAVLGQNSSGQMAKVGYSAFAAQAEAWNDEQRRNYAQILNGGFSTGTMGVNLISPPVFELEDNDVYVVLRGANLNLHPTNRKIEILDAADNSILAEVPVGQVQTYTEGTQLIFYYNFNALGSGTYKLKLTNGASTYITTLNFQIVAEVTNIDLSENNFDLITDYSNTESFATNDTVYYEAEDYGSSSATPIFSAKSDELFEQGDDWYLEVQLELAWGNSTSPSESPQTRVGIGYSSSTNEFIYKTLNYYFHRKSNNAYGYYSTKGIAETAMAVPFSTSIIFIKRGNVITTVCQSKIYNEVISNNSGYSLFVQIPKRIVKEILSIQIVKAYKFN